MAKENNNMVLVSIVAIVAIVCIVMLVSGSAKKQQAIGAKAGLPPNLQVAIDDQGNIYNGDFELVGKLADPEMKIYDSEGNMIGFAQINLPIAAE